MDSPRPRRKRIDETLALDRRTTEDDGDAWLVIAPGTPSERRVEIGRAPMIIGKDPLADISIADPTVSSRHAEIRRTPGGVQVRDLGSTNGTHIEGIAVYEAMLKDGVTLMLGETRVRFETRAPDDDAPDDLAGAPMQFGQAVGKSEPMRRVFALLSRIAATDLTVTLIGETGTGKDVMARAIHEASARRSGPFIVFDCGAVAPTLIESELFGHVKGAFTGAVADHAGAFERSDGGTLFLDEIGELALDLQPKLLRALEQRRVTRVGGTEVRAVDVRIVAATNRELSDEVRAGRFREDLYFRLSGALVHIPPLRERREDLPELIDAFLAELGPDLRVGSEALAVLKAYDWPGNVRELKNVLAGAAAVVDGKQIEPRDLMLFHKKRREPTLDRLPLAGRTLESIERAAIRQTLEQHGGNKTRAAKALGIAASTLYEKIKKYDL